MNFIGPLKIYCECNTETITFLWPMLFSDLNL